MVKNIKRQLAALLLMSGAASAALPPVVDGNAQMGASPTSAASMLGLYNRLEQLQREVQQMQGLIEEQAYVIDNLKKRQRDLYIDTDRRITQLEPGGKVGLGSDLNLPTTPGTSVQPEQESSKIKQPAQTLVNGSQDKLAYDKAFSSLKSGRYKQSITDFSGFVKNFPQSVYLPNALYWLGEASYVNRDFKRAVDEFNKVVTQYPAHSKAKDALLKIGFIQYESKQWKQSKETLTKVSTSYPGTTVAGLAQKRLDKLRQEKH